MRYCSLLAQGGHRPDATTRAPHCGAHSAGLSIMACPEGLCSDAWAGLLVFGLRCLALGRILIRLLGTLEVSLSIVVLA